VTGATWCATTYPASDNQGTLVDNGDGRYQYTFYRDITQTASIVARLTDSADGLSKKADMGDLSYNAALAHRLGIIISGNAPGTGTNTPNAVAFASTATPVPMVNTFNLGYDFVPAGGTPTNTSEIFVKASCSGCHDGKGIGHVSTASATNGVLAGVLAAFVGRNDPRLCVTGHTDQIKLPGISDALPVNIVASRLYGSKAQLVTKNILDSGLYEGLRRRLIAKNANASPAKSASAKPPKQ
jgi:OmcA/MtrC family decaheme c-type cytochrome